MDEKKTRILVLSHSSSIGGATASLDVVVTDLMENGYEVRLITPEGPMARPWRAAGLTIRLWKSPSSAWFGGMVLSSGAMKFSHWHLIMIGLLPFRLFKAHRIIRKAVESVPPDIVLINSLTLFPLGVLFPWTLGRPKPFVIWHLREVLNARLMGPVKRFVRWAVTHATDRMIAITSNERVGFEDFKDLVVIHNTIPPNWRSIEAGKRSDGEETDVRVMMASMMSPGKGFEDFLKAARDLRSRYQRAVFDLYTPRAPYPFRARYRGYPNTQQCLQTLLDSLSAIEVSRGINWYFEKEMSVELFGSYDIYVRPDRAGCPWGRDIIEAMWLGLPIVATGTSEEFIKDGVTGFLVPPNDHAALAERIARLIEDAGLRKRMSKETRRRALRLFHPSVHRDKILHAFRPGRALETMAVLEPSPEGD